LIIGEKENMRICDECKSKGMEITQAIHNCISCGVDLCEEHTYWIEGKPYCAGCDKDGEEDCPKCELPFSMCSCSSFDSKRSKSS